MAGVSGGSDSVALLRALIAGSGEKGRRLVAAHVDHGLRPGSERDARFVEELAGKLGVEFRLLSVRVEKKGRSPEEAARLARREALLGLVRETGAAALALAHTADDQAETVLARALVGTGPGGLAAMRVWNGPVWRPFLGTGRKELRNWLKALGQDWVEDPTNREMVFQRNRIRRHVLPLVREMVNPRAGEALCRLASLSAREEDYWDGWCARFLAAHSRREAGSVLLDALALEPLHPAQTARVLRRAAQLLEGAGDLLFGHVDDLLDLAAGGPGRSLTLPGGLTAWREHRGLRLAPERSAPEFGGMLAGPGRLELPHLGGRLVAEEAPAPEELAAGPEEAWIPLREVAWPITVRPPQVGERFHPLGAPGSKRLSRLLMDKKVPPWWRPRLVVVADRRGPLWVGPLFTAERARSREKKERFLRLRLVDTPPAPTYTRFSEHCGGLIMETPLPGRP